MVTWGLGRTPRSGLADAARQARAPVAVWRERLQGVRDGVEAAGLDWSGVPVMEREGNSRADGHAAGLALLSGTPAPPGTTGAPAPTAVLVATDALAFGVLQAARELGLRVPEDVSVVGFDDVEEAASCTPALTTVVPGPVRAGPGGRPPRRGPRRRRRRPAAHPPHRARRARQHGPAPRRTLMTVATLGLLAGALTTAAWLPQLLRTWRRRSAGDLSWFYLVTFGTGVGGWLAYGLLTGDPAILLTNVVTLALVASLVVLKAGTSARSRREPAEAAPVLR